MEESLFLRNRILVVLVGVLIMLGLVDGSARAAIPQTISYQGYLTDASDVPVDGSRSMVFSLYSDASGGTALWTETYPAVTVSNGIYQVTLGSITPLALPFDISYWLGVRVGEDGEMAPRQALTSAPYALRALTCEDASGNLTVSNNLNLPVTTTTKGIIMSGSDTLIHTYGTANFFAGRQAGNLVMTGTSNTALGTLALANNAGGDDNTASGWGALNNNTEGDLNTSNGFDALVANTTGSRNTAVGGYSLPSNISGNDNIAVGVRALSENTTASKNTAIGTWALTSQAFSNSGIAWDSYNTAVGYAALYDNAPTSTSNGINNTAIGFRALERNTTGSQNTAGGKEALRYNTSGNSNTASGTGALYSNTTASKNTALGTNALYSQSYDYGSPLDTNNTAVGYNALYTNGPTTSNNGINNTALGAYALEENTTGYSNTAAGANTLNKNTYGYGNTANGYMALQGNTGGNDNTAIGREALSTNSTGTNNTAIGSYTLRLNTGVDNTAIGVQALVNNAGGIANTAIGQRALFTNTTGYGNIAIGRNADVYQGDLTNATAIGYNAVVSRSNSLVLGGTGVNAVNVGIGTMAPTDALDVEGNIRLNEKDIYLRAETDTNHGLGWYGAGKLFASNSIDGPVAYGYSGGALGTTAGGQKVMMKWDTGSFDFYGYARFSVLSSGSTSVCLDTNNSLSACASDARMKKDITSLQETMDVLDALSKLRGVTFTWDRTNPRAAGMSDSRDLGMIAQEVEEVFPEVVHTDRDGYKSLDYPKLVAFLVEVNKAQQVELGELSRDVKEIQKELKALKDLMKK